MSFFENTFHRLHRLIAMWSIIYNNTKLPLEELSFGFSPSFFLTFQTFWYLLFIHSLNTHLLKAYCVPNTVVFLKKFYCYSIIVECLFSPSLHPTPAEPTSLPHLHPPHWFCPCVLYSSSCKFLKSLEYKSDFTIKQSKWSHCIN